MNRRIWTALGIIIVVFVVVGVVTFGDDEDIVEPPRDVITQIDVDLSKPYSGTITVLYPSSKVSDDDFQVVVGAREDAHAFLDQYFIPYEDPRRVRVRRIGETTKVSFLIFARDRLEFAFPQVDFKASWTPLWETLSFAVQFPSNYVLSNVTSEGLTDPPKTENRDGRWTMLGEAEIGGVVVVQASYTQSDISR